MKIRILSDLHVDINENKPLFYNDDVFTLICGDTAQSPSTAIEWINANIKNGLVICGNHLPYENYGAEAKDKKTISEFKNEFAAAFPVENNITFFDESVGVISKVVNNILFVGSVMYTDMQIKHPIFNPTGNREKNYHFSGLHMNDFNFGITDKTLTKDGILKLTYLHPRNYAEWFDATYEKIDRILTENEAKASPLPVVLFTHHPLISDYIYHSYYIETSYSHWEYNNPSYASDRYRWLEQHHSIKVYCCGHVHDVEPRYRILEHVRSNGDILKIVNNARGYIRYGHDRFFDENLILDTDTWNIECHGKLADTRKELEDNESKKL